MHQEPIIDKKKTLTNIFKIIIRSPLADIIDLNKLNANRHDRTFVKRLAELIDAKIIYLPLKNLKKFYTIGGHEIWIDISDKACQTFKTVPGLLPGKTIECGSAKRYIVVGVAFETSPNNINEEVLWVEELNDQSVFYIDPETMSKIKIIK